MQIIEEIGFDDEDEEEDVEDEDEFDSDQEEIKEELEDLKDNDEDEEVYGGERVSRPNRNEDDDGGEIIGADEDIDDLQIGVKRQRPAQQEGEQIDKRQLKRQKKAILQRYYSGTFYWKCASWIMY